MAIIKRYTVDPLNSLGLNCVGPLIHGFFFTKYGLGTSLVAQWLRICLPVQKTRVRALVWEDPTCHGAIKPLCHNY